MSLLMDALKQAEHAKHSPESPPPAAPPAGLAPVADTSADLAELSLSPVELTIPDLPMEPEVAPHLRLATPPEPKAEPDAAPSTTPPEANVMPSTPVQVRPEPADVGDRHNSPAAAARIMATSAAQQIALRRRNLVGIISLVGLVAAAVGGYYYYATLAQQTPYLGLPQPPAIEAASMTEGSVDVAPNTDTDTAAQDAAPIAATDTAMPAEAVVDAIALPEQTPWQEGLPPIEAHSTQDWEPAPVDPRVLRGEQPAPITETAEEMTEPAATITITRSTQPNQVSLDLQTAYSDFQTGRLALAEQGYRQVLARDAHNRDARMGLAAIAVRNGQLASAREHYRAVLQRNPKDLSAHAALADLMQNRPADSESQLKLMLTEQPQSAQLHFALANLYAEQQRWPYAQQAYFEAQRLSPEHPDYAFNLAVSLEHLGQPQLALEYYRRAILFAGPHNAQFDLNAARQRIETLTAQAQP
jgi:Flp pilus assembly protein TadD